jgi:hypothetical protein
MGDNPSKPIQSGPILVLKENKPPKRCSKRKSISPKLKVDFNYMKPLNFEMEEMPDD